MKNNILKRGIAFFAALLMAFLFVCAPHTVSPSAVFAAAGTLDMDHTDVMADLEGSTIDGKPFDVKDYGFNEWKKTSVLFLAEYCYSFYSSRQGNFNLYLYVWNPQGLQFLENHSQNTVELSFGEANTVPSANYRLTCVSVSSQQGYEKLFYKFRVALTDSQKQSILDSLSSSERIYHVSSVQLMEQGGFNPTSFYVNSVYTYSGYSVGYGPNAGGESLSYRKTVGETLDIERQGGLHTTFFRPDGASTSDGYTQDTLQSIYFSVPEKYFADDYEFVAARMEWLFAQTRYGLVTGNKELYRSLLEWVGQTYEGLPGWLNARGQPFPTEYGFSGHLAGFNGNREVLSDMPYLAFLFPSNSWETDSADDYIVPWEDILQWMQKYHDEFDSEDKTYWDAEYEWPHVEGQSPLKGINVNFHRPYGGELVTVDGVEYPYSKALFAYVAPHKTTMDITSDKRYSLLDLSISERWKWYDDGYISSKEDYISYTNRFDNIEAFHIVDEADFKSSDEATCLNLYIDINDYKEFESFYDKATAKGEKVVLVRYDVSKYYSCEAREGIPRNKNSLVTGYDPGDTNARIFSMGVYLGLDLIHLEFNNGEVSFFLPVASTPVDAGSDSTPALITHSDKKFPWGLVFALVALLIVVILLAPILPYLIKAVIWVVTLPFKLIGAIGKGIKNVAGKRRRKDKE